MITKAWEKAEAYTAHEQRFLKSSIGCCLTDYEAYQMTLGYADGYRAALREVISLIKTSKTPNVLKLLNEIKS